LKKNTEDYSTLEERSNQQKEEINQSRTKSLGLEDEVLNLSKKKKKDLEKDLSSVKFDINETKSRNERIVEGLNKKLSDTERELTEQLNSQNQTKTSLETKTKQARDQYSELKKTIRYSSK